MLIEHDGDFAMPLDPRTATLLQHKGSPVPLEPGDWRQDERAASSMPWPQRPEYQRGPVAAPRAADPLRPRYTEKLSTSPRYPSLAEAAQRRRDFWGKMIGRGSLGLMVGACVGALWFGTGIFPAGAFAVGLITFIATCFYGGWRNRNRV